MAILILFVRGDVTFLLSAVFLLHVYRSAPEWQITKRRIANAVLLALPITITIVAVLSFGRIDV